MQETWVQFLGWEDPLEKEMATHSSILAREIPRTEKPGDLQSMGSQRVGARLSDWTATMGGRWHPAMVLVYISPMQKNDGWGIYPPSLYLHQVAVQVFCPFLAEWSVLPYCAVLRVLHISWIQVLGQICDAQILPPSAHSQQKLLMRHAVSISLVTDP